MGHLSNCKNVSLAGMESTGRRVAQNRIREAGSQGPNCEGLEGAE